MPRYTRSRSVLPTAPSRAQRIGRCLRRPSATGGAERWLLRRLAARMRGALLAVAVVAAMCLAMRDDYHKLVLPEALNLAEEAQP